MYFIVNEDFFKFNAKIMKELVEKTNSIKERKMSFGGIRGED